MADAPMTREEIEALLARVPEGHTPGPWYPVFNGHFWDISLDVAPMSHSVADTCASNSMYGEHMGPDGQPGNHGEANAALIALAPDFADALRTALATISDLTREREAAREALRPFAAEADEWADIVPDDYHPMQPEMGHKGRCLARAQTIRDIIALCERSPTATAAEIAVTLSNFLFLPPMRQDPDNG